MKAVTFLLAHTVGALYNVGETAGFSDEIAADLIERGIAEPAKVKKQAAAPDPYTADDFKDEDEAVIDALIKKHKITVAADSDKAAKIAAIVEAKIAK